MEINDKLAARRLERAAADRHAETQVKLAADAAKVAEEARDRDALDAIAVKLSTPELTITRDGDRLALPAPVPEPVDPEVVEVSVLRAMLDREARKAWTPTENWQVIGCTSAGVALLHIPFLGIPLLIFGIWRGSRVGRSHRSALIAQYPDLFGSLSS